MGRVLPVPCWRQVDFGPGAIDELGEARPRNRRRVEAESSTALEPNSERRPVSAEDCCAIPGSSKSASACPVSGSHGERVPWRTVAALLSGAIPSKQEFWLCPDPSCRVVYFGAAGRLVSIAELRVHPGSKDGGELLCYCLQLRKQDLRLEVTAPTRIIEQITDLVRAGGCACEVRNPSGKCCLGEVRKLSRRILETSVPDSDRANSID